MQWIHAFQLFLFDFDGLLVNTEGLHFQAYLETAARFGDPIDWPFSRFCELAHLDGKALKQAIIADHPALEANWSSFYEEKKKNYQELIGGKKVELMPGVESLLRALEKAAIRRSVVTNSPRIQIEIIRSQLPILQTIPHWVTREDYEKAKPAPDSYQCAIERYGEKGDRIIGFEDSVRGIRALLGTSALPILICPAHHPLLETATEYARHFESFLAIPPQGWWT